MKTVTALDVYALDAKEACYEYRRQSHDDDGNVKTVGQHDYSKGGNWASNRIIATSDMNDFIADKCDNHGYTVHYVGVTEHGLYITLTRSR